MKFAYIVFTITFMFSIWCIDVSVTTINLGIMTNGFFMITPIQSYHLGLYGLILSWLGMMITKDKEAKNGDRL